VDQHKTGETRAIGVEEELLLVDPANGIPQAMSADVIRYAHEHGEVPRGSRDMPGGSAGDGAPDTMSGETLETEFQREQLEVCTRPCGSLKELSDQVRWARHATSEAARGVGVAVAALATSPVIVRPSLTPSRRYRRMADAYALTADEQLTCGCHVHVSVTSPDEGAAVLDRIRPWLPPLLALSANSPFWQGRDTGYESWRQQVWWRWPSSGPTELFESAKAYRATVEAMVGTGVLLDEGMIYFDARLSRRYPTVEIRVADVCLHADDAVLIAALVRALVDTASRAWQAGEPPDPVRTELLRLAMWRASRSGLRGDLLHPLTRRAAPAKAVLGALIDHVSPALERSGDLETVEELLHRLQERGNGAGSQRAVYARTRDVTAVVFDAVRRTIER
jgi:glutamate---cysteine ligase / carboxylate-amine ligase